MKKLIFLTFTLLAFLAELILLLVFALTPVEQTNDVVTMNRVLQSLSASWGDMDGFQNPVSLDFVVLDKDGEIVYKTREGLRETVTQAAANGDIILDVVKDGQAVGKALFCSNGAKLLTEKRNAFIVIFAVLIAVQDLIFIAYFTYLERAVVKPFRKLKGFAERVAGGNLDIPLEMDRNNIFGAFTESFDIMRAELKKSRLAEAKANESKKELVAKLSHDIKTPVASVKAVAELGIAIAKEEKVRENYRQIILKADQINSLVSNLFTATLEELQQLTVTPTSLESGQVKAMLENADYLHRAVIPELPECLLYADALRLQQVFDNIFANSYKYAGTEISVKVTRRERGIEIEIEDFGGEVEESELPLLTEKYKRGSNAKDKDGAGLGLYISDYFMKQMHGALNLENGARGLKVTVTVALS